MFPEEFSPLRYRYGIVFSLALVFSGICCLAAGAVMIYIGITGEQVVWLEKGNFKIYAGGFGAITMVASLGWGYLATRTFLSLWR